MKAYIKYEDIVSGVRENIITSSEDKTSYSNLENLKLDNVDFAKFDNPCALYSVVLDSELDNFPHDPQNYDWGFVSKGVNQLDGKFETPPIIVFTSPVQFSSSGILLTFDVERDQWASEIIIEWYRGDDLSGYTFITSKQFFPNNSVYYCENSVEDYNRWAVRVIKFNMPHNRSIINNINIGLTRTFPPKEIERIDIIQEVDPISSKIFINTATIMLRPKTDIDFIFQSRQGIRIYYNDVLKMVCFIDEPIRLSDNRWKISAYDYIGLLDNSTFYGGMYKNKRVDKLLDEILGEENIPYTIEPDLAEKTISDYLAIMTRREALAQILLVINAVCDTSDSEYLNIYKISNEIKTEIPLKSTFQGGTVKNIKKVYEVQLHQHMYNPIDETFEAYNAANSGTGQNITVRFTEPLHELSIINGNILQSNVNYAIIDANVGCILTGKRYNHSTQLHRKKSPIWNVNDVKKIISIENVTISCDPERTLNNIYNYLTRTQILEVPVKVEDFKCGDNIIASTKFMGKMAGVCESMRYSLIGGFIKAKITLRSGVQEKGISKAHYMGNELYSGERIGTL